MDLTAKTDLVHIAPQGLGVRDKQILQRRKFSLTASHESWEQRRYRMR